MKYTKNVILVPTNFSEHAIKSLDMAIDIAKKWNAKLIIAHVIDLPEYEGFDETVKALYEKDIKDSALQLLKGLSFKAYDRGVTTGIEVIVGKAGPEILKYIKEENVGLVVLGSKSYKKMDEMLAGSSMERIIRHSTCPVLTIKEPRDIKEIKDIVFATDLGLTQAYITTELKRIQEISGAKLHILKVNTKKNWKSDDELEKQLVAFNKIHELENYVFKVSNNENTEEGIIHYCKSIGPNILAMPIHGLIDRDTHLNNYFITERILLNNPSIFWSCINSNGSMGV
jgi:nucleotide-binding universal stress UspA family protein